MVIQGIINNYSRLFICVCMCTYFAIHVHILCGGIINGYLWIMWLFEGLSVSNLMLLSTFPIQNIGIWYIL